jgi:membrane-bound lytic murein transglycosylase A
MSHMLGLSSLRSRALAVGAILGVLASCSMPPVSPPLAPAEKPEATPPVAAPPVTAPPSKPSVAPVVRTTAKSRWVSVAWDELPGWPHDTTIYAWASLLKSCERPAPGWATACESARSLREPDEARVRGWLQTHLQPYRVEPLNGGSDGLITGYYEPLIAASRTRRAAFQVPLYAPPSDLAKRKPWWTRSQIESEPAARAALRGREIAYVADPLDALVLQIQGSGRLRITEPDGRTRLVRAAFAGHNDQPYRSIGRWLVEQGALTLEQASWPAIKAWARANPARVREMLNVNPRYVFFREEPLADPSLGPLGAQGVPLTPGRSIAVDKDSIPYGTPVWIDTTEPAAPPAAPTPRPLQRLVVAQDTGGAITGALRADYFWGWGDGAEEFAGRMKQTLRMWVLIPRG